MPIKKDETGKRWVEIHFTVPGTPEQVWQAMATGSGNAAWFTNATIEERVGGSVKFHFGPEMSSSGEVTMWEPPHLFGYVERQWSEGAPPIATEITIASRAGGQCVVRMVHSLFSSTDDWDDQMEGFESGWTGFIEVLRIYLANFAGMKAASFQVMHTAQADHGAVWSRLLEKLNLAGANVGERREASHPEKLSGVVEHMHQDQKIREVTLRLDAPMPGVFVVGSYGTGNGINASMSTFFYGDRAERQVATSQPKWQQWIRETLSF
jgi:uncharacterized protein YndB with AHSA1/START domain